MATTRIMALHTGKGRSVAKTLRDVTGYMEDPLKTENGETRQSFKPGEITPEQANRIGYELATRFTKGRPASFEEFLSFMREAGYTVNTNRKHITFSTPEWKQPTRMDTLKEEYTEAAVQERMA